MSRRASARQPCRGARIAPIFVQLHVTLGPPERATLRVHVLQHASTLPVGREWPAAGLPVRLPAKRRAWGFAFFATAGGSQVATPSVADAHQPARNANTRCRDIAAYTASITDEPSWWQATSPRSLPVSQTIAIGHGTSLVRDTRTLRAGSGSRSTRSTETASRFGERPTL